jgi:hypothetical protein
MARLEIDGERLVVRLRLLERLGALVGHEPSAPRSAVRTVRVSDHPYRELRGIRAPGTGFPGVIALGTRRYRGGKDFVAVYGRSAAVVVDLDGARWGRFVVSCNDPGQVAQSLDARP